MKSSIGPAFLTAQIAIAAIVISAQGALAAEQMVETMPTEDHYADMVDYPNLCTQEDWIIFNGVSDADGKLVSVCMAEGDDTTPSHLTLRYGSGEDMVSYPDTAEGSFQAFTIRRYTRPQTTYLKFETTEDGLNYEILAGGEGETFSAFFRIVREDEEGAVLEHDLTVTTAPYALMGLEDIVPMEPFDE